MKIQQDRQTKRRNRPVLLNSKPRKRVGKLSWFAIYLVTTNEQKVHEARHVLQGVEIEHADIDVPEIKSQSMLETIEEKAKAAYKIVKKPVVVEDTGFFLDAHPGFPGTYTKFCVKLVGLEGFLKLLEGKERGASFVTMTAFYDGKKMKVFEGRVDGSVSESIRKPVPSKLPFDAIFIPRGETRTYSQMTKGEKARTSHRAKAFAALAKWLK